jgi:hypothetical protein
MNKRYFNKKQLEAMMISANKEYIIASRGFGKSEGIDAPRLLRNVFAMPRSNGAIVSPTYAKLLQNTLPAVCHALARLGYKRDIHYVVGRKPPKSFLAKPYIEPFKYDYVMSWFNGTIIHFLSFDRPMSANSMNLDFIMGFEAKYLNYTKLVNEVFQANRGNTQYFGDCPWHHSMLFSTDMPTQSSGYWILDKEKDMDTELIEHIRYLIASQEAARIDLSFKPDSVHFKRIFNNKEKELSSFRSIASFYAEYDIFDNLEIITEKRIKELKKELPLLIYRTSILNHKLRKVSNGFYSSLNEATHCYTPPSPEYMELLNYNTNASIDCRHDGDVDMNEPLCIANDYNAAINSIVTGQRIGSECRTVRSSYVKTPKKLQDVVQDWCNYNVHMHNKRVIYFFDATAIYANAMSGESFSSTVIKILQKNGWDVTDVYIGQPVAHNVKHNWFDLGFKGDPDFLFPTFNKYNNEYLITAMDLAGVKVGRNGFEKDKSMEKEDDTPDNPDEIKTHITDAWDTMYIGMNFYYPSMQGAFPAQSY